MPNVGLPGVWLRRGELALFSITFMLPHRRDKENSAIYASQYLSHHQGHPLCFTKLHPGPRATQVRGPFFILWDGGGLVCHYPAGEFLEL